MPRARPWRYFALCRHHGRGEWTARRGADIRGKALVLGTRAYYTGLWSPAA
jgi:hypothetical protein